MIRRYMPASLDLVAWEYRPIEQPRTAAAPSRRRPRQGGRIRQHRSGRRKVVKNRYGRWVNLPRPLPPRKPHEFQAKEEGEVDVAAAPREDPREVVAALRGELREVGRWRERAEAATQEAEAAAAAVGKRAEAAEQCAKAAEARAEAAEAQAEELQQAQSAFWASLDSLQSQHAAAMQGEFADIKAANERAEAAEQRAKAAEARAEAAEAQAEELQQAQSAFWASLNSLHSQHAAAMQGEFADTKAAEERAEVAEAQVEELEERARVAEQMLEAAQAECRKLRAWYDILQDPHPLNQWYRLVGAGCSIRKIRCPWPQCQGFLSSHTSMLPRDHCNATMPQGWQLQT